MEMCNPVFKVRKRVTMMYCLGGAWRVHEYMLICTVLHIHLYTFYSECLDLIQHASVVHPGGDAVPAKARGEP